MIYGICFCGRKNSENIFKGLSAAVKIGDYVLWEGVEGLQSSLILIIDVNVIVTVKFQ